MYKLRQSQKIIIIKINKIKWVMVCVNINIELSLNCQVMRWFGSAPAIVVMWWWVSNLYLFVKYSHFVVEETGWRIGYGQLLCHFSRACTSCRNHHVLVGGILGIICQVSHYHEGSCSKRLGPLMYTKKDILLQIKKIKIMVLILSHPTFFITFKYLKIYRFIYLT